VITTLAPELAATGTTTVHPIPFRAESHGIASDAATVFATLALLLAGCLVLVWIAKKKGWLDRWVSGATTPVALGSPLRLDHMLRLSPKTVLYRVSDGRDRYLVIESTATAQLTALPRAEDVTTHA
jgi:hypothetical protein